MIDNFEEIFAKEDKEITSLVQEWINENIEAITYKIADLELKHNKIGR